MRLGEGGGQPQVVQFCLDHLARLAFIRGEYARAAEILQQAREMAKEWGLPQYYSDWTVLWQVRTWLAQGNLGEATAWAESMIPDSPGEHEFVHFFEFITLAQVWAAQGKVAQALDLLARLHVEAETKEFSRSVIECLVLEVALHYRNGETALALEKLPTALRLGEPERYVRVFMDTAEAEAEVVIALWRREYDRRLPGGPPDDLPRLAAYADKLLAAFAAQGHSAAGNTPEAAAPPAPAGRAFLPDALSARELEVLRLIADGLTNAEIAQALVIGAGTVKTHVNNIFRKLDAKTRTQAVAHARALGLLDG
jgi:ATP/maltotriose-dependent transcriptional regulator MalT